MLRTVSNRVLTLVILVVSTALFGCAGRSSPTPNVLEPRDELGAAFDKLVDTLRDVEREINLPRLQDIIRGENPFIPGIDSDAWAAERGYKTQDGQKALVDFLAARIETLALLDALVADDWQLPARHAIFGPTQLSELAGFMARHDRLHIRQVYETIETITKLQI